MNPSFRRFLLGACQVVLALGAGVMLCAAVALLLFDSPAREFGTGAWLDNPAPKVAFVLLAVVMAVGAVCYLNRFAVLGRRTWIALVATVPGIPAAVWLFFAIAWTISPPSFM